MKTITIGRGDGANIIIDNEMISRRHAILKISTSGKMEIVDMGRNGTFVNGIKLRPNVPFPVTRKDVVRFADQDSPFKLDWDLVPDNSKIFKTATAAIVGLLAIILLILLIRSCITNEENTTPSTFIEDTSVQSSSENPAETPTIDTNKKNGVSEESRESDTEENAEEKVREKNEKKKDQKDISGKTIQQLFPTPAKKDASTKKKKSETVKPSDVKTKNNEKDGASSSENKKTVIM